jgi:DNA-binding MarR family transcriptional regulator
MRRSERKRNAPDLGVLASRVLFSLQKELFRTLAEQGHPDLRPRHGAVLAYLDEEGSRATDLSLQSGQHKQVIGTLVDELVALGYVERRLDEMARSDAIVAAIEERHAQAVGSTAYDAFKVVFTQVAKPPMMDE